MSRQLKNKVRGFVLLLVFSMNTLAGFACSAGMNMGYNKTHHQHENLSPAVDVSHHHNHHQNPTAQMENGKESNNDHKDCCGDISKWNLADKSIVSNITLQAPVFLVAFLPHFLFPDEFSDSFINNSISHSLRRSWRSPDHSDLRIVIQSFQI